MRVIPASIPSLWYIFIFCLLIPHMRIRREEDRNLGTLHDESVKAHPDRTALVVGRTGKEISYRELATRINRAGNALEGLGVKPGDRVALVYDNDVVYVFLFLGAIRLGAVPVPVNVELPQDTVEFIIADSDASLAVSTSDPEILSKAANVAATTPSIDDLAVGTDDPEAVLTDASVSDRDGFATHSLTEAMSGARDELVPASVGGPDPAIQPYTSGSTGKPKGVILTHGGMWWCTTVLSQVRLLTREDCALVAAPLYHKNAMTIIKPLLMLGGSTVVLEEFDPEEVIRAVDKYGVTYLTGVPAMYRLILEAREALERHDISTVNWASCGSDAVSEALFKDFDDIFDAVILEGYGLTEGGPAVTASPWWGTRKLGSAGLALPDVETRVVDPDTGEQLPSGETGELLVSSPGVATYYDRPEKETEAFERRDGAEFLRTGDLVRKDDGGYHYIVGRLDDMLIVGGENVYPAEVEDLLLKHDAVTEVAVVGVPHDVKGEVPVAFVTASGDATEEDFKSQALTHGPAYAHPRRIFFLENMPLTGVEKIDRRTLAERASERME